MKFEDYFEDHDCNCCKCAGRGEHKGRDGKLYCTPCADEKIDEINNDPEERANAKGDMQIDMDKEKG